MAPLSKRILTLFVLASLLPFLTGATIVIRGPRVPTAGGGSFTDTFSYAAESWLGDATDWVNVSATDYLKVKSGGHVVPTNSVNAYVRHTGTLNANHYAEVDADFTSHGGQTVGAIARAQSGSDSCYYAVIYNNTMYVGKRNAGSETLLHTSAALGIGAPSTLSIRIEVTGAGSSARITAKWKEGGGGWNTELSSSDPGGTYLDDGFGGVIGYGTSEDGTLYRMNEYRSGNL